MREPYISEHVCAKSPMHFVVLCWFALSPSPRCSIKCSPKMGPTSEFLYQEVSALTPYTPQVFPSAFSSPSVALVLILIRSTTCHWQTFWCQCPMNIFPLSFPEKHQAAGEGASSPFLMAPGGPSGTGWHWRDSEEVLRVGPDICFKNTTHRQNVGPFPVMSSLLWKWLVHHTSWSHECCLTKQSLFLFLAMNVQDYRLIIGSFWNRVGLGNPDLPLWVSFSISISIYSFLTTLLTKSLMFSFLIQNHKEL